MYLFIFLVMCSVWAMMELDECFTVKRNLSWVSWCTSVLAAGDWGFDYSGQKSGWGGLLLPPSLYYWFSVPWKPVEWMMIWSSSNMSQDWIKTLSGYFQLKNTSMSCLLCIHLFLLLSDIHHSRLLARSSLLNLPFSFFKLVGALLQITLNHPPLLGYLCLHMMKISFSMLLWEILVYCCK